MKRRTRPNAKFLTLKQAEAEYGLPYMLLWRLVTDKVLRRLELDDYRAIYIRRADLDAFLDSHMQEAS